MNKNDIREYVGNVIDDYDNGLLTDMNLIDYLISIYDLLEF